LVGVPKPEPVTLRPEEQSLLEQITFEVSVLHERETTRASCIAAAVLARSLLERDGIPKVRLRYFTDPELNIGGRKKSRKDVFEANGTTGDAILQHPHFLRYLKYFIFGPDVRADTVARFRQIVVDDRGTSGMVLDQLCQFSRAETRRLSPEERRDAVEEFFKLALECGLDVGVARSIRDAVRTAK